LQIEARAGGAINHPNIVGVQDIGVADDGQPYIVMDYVQGDTLQAFLDSKSRLPLAFALRISLQVCDALAALHASGIIHRDLKPSNIILVGEGDSRIAKLLDFGIAKILSTNASCNRLTRAGEIFGSPGVMSPEQCLGKEVDQRSDLYSLGCLMYQLITGATVFGKGSAFEVLTSQVHEIPSRVPFLATNNPIPALLEIAIFKLLNKDPERRFQTANELKDELNPILDALAAKP